MLDQALRREFSGEILFDTFSRGRYSTDASFYQIMPQGVAIPRGFADVEAALAVARDADVPVTGRGGGTSQCGQTINSGLILDNSVHFNRILELDPANRRVVVEPGIVLDDLNRALKPHGLWFPVDVSTASRATIGGMAANNSCGGRSLRYGTMRDNVISIEAIMADGTLAQFGPVGPRGGPSDALVDPLLAMGRDHAALIEARIPKLTRRVGGYNIDALVPKNRPVNLSHLLVGSEGTLAYFTRIELKLWPLVGQRVLGVCHFPSFYQAMDATQHLVALNPLSVELVDNTMIGLSRQIPMFRPTIEQFVKGDPAALLLVEFDEGDAAANAEKLRLLDERMADLGFDWRAEGKGWGGVVPIADQRLQGQIAEVRKSGLNIMMSMKQEGKPVSFVEDCAVELPDLAEYTRELSAVFERHGTRGTWYAHASVGCLHVRPVLNLKLDADVKRMRAIAEEAFALVSKYKGSHSGEHGDGIVRSEFHERMFGTEITTLFREVKDRFDPDRRFNPGKIVDAPKMDDRRLFRFAPGYTVAPLKTEFDWSAWPGAGGGFQGAVEMCNNNGACRKLAGGTMCPSYRVTRHERDVTRGRANTLRLAISGQLGPDALTSDAMADTLALCVSCKGCKRECPTGVDMARMKIEVLAARARSNGLTLHDRLVAYLPRYAPVAARLHWLMNLRNRLPLLARLMQRPTGFSAARALPHWSARPFRDAEAQGADADIVLFADPFNRWFEPENLRAAVRVLNAAGRRVTVARPLDGGPPLQCGRTLLSAGLVDEARTEARRLIDALLPHIRAGRSIVGLEPSSLLTLRDEIPAMLPGDDTAQIAGAALMFEEYVAAEHEAGRWSLPLRPPGVPVLLHGHCHQKALDVMPAIHKALALLPETDIQLIETSCCGMAGSFGYGLETEAISRQMGELSLFPAIRAAPGDAIIVADGTSCRHQIADGTGRRAIHVARLFELALQEAR
ncbi:MAG: FAD-binding and (Fe-S)-binding domain-containing protein [Paracoccus sp. (in: a-proteobacteria)]|uniref:FAD-binding and (Fe-S)-binding domain-containing protein n=2 Tax=Paracoccus TaxID=265 RepID=UPI000C3F6B4B|nr:FAD-binding and (Fe-S)-binding domain-containing protein [Paracoccus sp. UBA5162]MAN55217.1 FAD-binding oxidoreductase [Paracoccus sp. (in: a-proteobacteria)]MDB2550989.1 FAD-binding protein [Paracoccus sp. (in: a-proteobacteria)]